MPETTATRHEQGQQDTYHEYEAKYVDIIDRLSVIYARLGELEDEETSLTSSASSDTLYEGGDPDDALKLLIEEYASSHTPGQTTAAIPLLAEMHGIFDEARTIDAEALPVAKATFAEKSKAIVDSTDWDKLADQLAEGYSDGDISRVIRMVSNQSEYDTFAKILQAVDTLNQVQDKLHADGFAKPTDIETSNETYIGHGNLQQVITDWQEQTDGALDYVSLGRRRALVSVFPHIQLSHLANFAGLIGLNGDDAVAIPGAIIDALEKAAAKHMTAFDNHDIDMLMQNHFERPNALFISGSELLTKTADLQDPRAFFDALFHEWPHWMSRGIGIVKVAPTIDDDKHGKPELTNDPNEQQPAAKQIKNATWSQSENTLTVNAHQDFYDEMVDFGAARGIDETQVRTIICPGRKEQIESTSVHELMHNGHNNVLPVRWLRQWYAAVAKDDIAVTDYVRQKKDSAKNPGPDDNATQLQISAQREDLCDTVAGYRYRLAHLLSVSPERCFLVQQLFKSYKPETLMAMLGMVNNIAPDAPDRESTLDMYDSMLTDYFKKPPDQSPIFSKL